LIATGKQRYIDQLRYSSLEEQEYIKDTLEELERLKKSKEPIPVSTFEAEDTILGSFIPPPINNTLIQ
jgi:hypothetical protein